MNQLDASAAPMDIFGTQPDLTPYKALLPDLALNNLMVQPAGDRETGRWIRESERQDFTSADRADPEVLNRIIWFSVRGKGEKYPPIASLPALDVIRTISKEEFAKQLDLNGQIKNLLARRNTKTRIAP
jgi:hypothetical protein